jgi:hypothetical protein
MQLDIITDEDQIVPFLGRGTAVLEAEALVEGQGRPDVSAGQDRYGAARDAPTLPRVTREAATFPDRCPDPVMGGEGFEPPTPCV